MNPAPEAPGSQQDEPAALRRQLILAQVQLMELEDARADHRTRLAEARSLLAHAQAAADRALLRQDQLEDERRRMKNSRSWRCTAPLRALERALQRRGRDRSAGEAPAFQHGLDTPTPFQAPANAWRLQGWCAAAAARPPAVRLVCGEHLFTGKTEEPGQNVSLAPNAPPAPAAACRFTLSGALPVGIHELRLEASVDGSSWSLLRRLHFAALPPAASPCDRPPLATLLGGRRPPARPPAPHPRRILFALYGDITSNSALHVAALANELVARGHECIVAVPHGAELVRTHRAPGFRCVTYADCGKRAALFAGGAGPDLVHAWTTAERVRRFTTTVAAEARARLLVHLEDNEGDILAAELRRPEAELAALPAAELERLVGLDRSHPHRRREFLARADACTVIVDRLAELVPPGKPVRIIPPGVAPEFFPRPRPAALRTALGLEDDHTVLFYHGNLHATNRADMAELHEALVALNATGTPTTLIRAGHDCCALPGDLAQRAAQHLIPLGRIARHDHLAPLLALADIFVQPGAPDSFNNYRFPSKLPEFFASGRPVILPRSNLGTVVRHGTDAFVLDRADAAGIAAAIRTLRADPALASRLAAGAAAFAREHFSWDRSAESLAAFYETIMAVPR